jgi:membrane-associated phospholipid phosphatase
MTPKTFVIDIVLSGVLIVGAYQFYFWCQRNHFFEPREFSDRLDRWIPYFPSWVWIYSLLYYPAILAVNVALKTGDEFTHVAVSYLLLLAVQGICFLVFPVSTPAQWRVLNTGGNSAERLLSLVQRFDRPTNSFPSMHTSVAMLTALHLYPALGVLVMLFPVLIGLSCLFTKQHYLIDVPAGAALGWLVFQTYVRYIAI